jgi:sugar (pentulose or hexulose) kinase
MTNIIGLDLGTTTVTGVLLGAGRREVLRLAQRRNDAALPVALPTRAEQNPHRLRALALEVLSELAAGSEPVDGLALTGQKHGLLCVDGEGQPLAPLISWQDRRTAEPLPGGSTVLERLHARLAGLDWQRNGCRIAHGYGAATLFWLAQQGELPPGTHRVCTIADWLVSQLAATPVQTDPTFAASWGVYDLVAGGWNAALLERLGLEARLFPTVRPSGEKVGGLARAVAQETGLPASAPVCNAVGDTQASFLGSVADPEQTILLNLGTGGQICWLASGFELPSEAVETRPLPGGRTLRVGASLCGGAAYAWLNATIRAWLAEFGVQIDEESAYRRLNALAAACDDVQGLRVRTTFLGVRGDPSVQAGAIEGITLGTLRLGALARATLVGIVDELRDLYRAHSDAPARHTLVAATGGGVTRNPLLPDLIAERFGLPVEVPQQGETAAIGAAILPLSLYPVSDRW